VVRSFRDGQYEARTPAQRAVAASGLTEEALAAESGVARSSVSRMLSGERLPAASLAMALSRLTGLPVAELFPEGRFADPRQQAAVRVGRLRRRVLQ